jgi:group I intron endonuclease
MEFIYNGHSKSAGIYKLTNKQNGRIYIGSSVRFEKRWKQHETSLLIGKHSNKFLLADFNKCGTDAFIFEILEVIDGTKEERLLKEETYIKQYYDDGKQCYNLCDRAISREGNNSKDPAETAKKCSETQKRLWADPEERQKRIEGKDGQRRANIGKAAKLVQANKSIEEKEAHAASQAIAVKEQWKDPEIRARRIAGLKKRGKDGWHNLRGKLIVCSPSGELVEVNGIGDFCILHKLQRRQFRRMVLGKFTHHHGWTMPSVDNSTVENQSNTSTI